MLAELVMGHQDRYAEDLLQELHRFIQGQGNHLAFPEDSSIPGFPVIPADAEVVYRDLYRCYQTRWGLLRDLRVEVRYYEYPNLYGKPYRLLEAGEEPLPEGRAPELGTAVVDAITGDTVVYAGRLTDDGAARPAWEKRLRFSLDQAYHRHKAYLDTVRKALARDGLPIYPDTLFYRRPRDYPWTNEEGVPVAPAHISNDEVRLPVVGFAYDLDTSELVYLHIVGHKTALRSIWGSLNTAHTRYLHLETPAVRRTCTSSHRYTTYSRQDAHFDSLHFMQIVDRRALESNLEEGTAYLLVPKGAEPDDIFALFAQRLNAVLPIGISPAWGSRLHREGETLGLTDLCLSGGDVEKVYKVQADEEWLTVIDDLAKAGELVIED